MKKDQLNRVKDTTNTHINKAYHFSSLGIPKFKNTKEAVLFITIQQETVSVLEKRLADYKGWLENSHKHVDYWQELYEESNEVIRRLKMGDIDDNAYEELKNSLKEKETRIEQQETEIRALKKKIKEGKSFCHKDFIMN